MKDGAKSEIMNACPPAPRDGAGQSGDRQPMRGRLVNARLLRLLMLVRLSGEITYHRQTGFVELHRRLLSLIGNYGPLASNELSALSGQEKAQISRAVRLLSAAGLIRRASLRARITLSDAGEEMFEQIMHIARARDDALRDGIAPDEMEGFARLTTALTERAALLFAQERQLAEGGAIEDDDDVAEPPPMPQRLQHVRLERPFARMVAPPLITLTSYLKRSATLAYRRETGLSGFQWQVLSQVGEYDTITLAELIGLLGRHKSQVGRTVKWLEAEGIVQRRNVRGRRDVLLNCSAEGAAMYEVLCESARRRDDYLFADITAPERAAYVATIDRLTDNASLLLAEVRAGDAG